VWNNFLINRVVALGLGIHGNAVLGAVSQKVLSALERLNELGIAPRSDGFDLGIKSLGAHFETNLIVSLSGGAVSDVCGSLLGGDAYHLLGDAGTGDRCSKQVFSLVDGVALEGLEDVVGDEFFAEVGDDAFEGAAVDGLGLDGLEVLVVLADISAECNDVEALFAEPFEDDGGIKSAGVGEDNLGLGGAGHD